VKSVLDGVRVLDLTRVLAGPFAGRVLAEMGADVVKVEFTRGDPARTIGPHRGDRSLYFSSLNSGKRGVYLDPSTKHGRAALEALTAGSDILLESFKRSTASALGLDPAGLLERYPELVAVTVCGFGRDSERADEGTFDVTIQAEGGIMAVTGEPGGKPVRAGVALSDLAAGMWAALGAVGALFARERGAGGRHVEVPMLDSTLPLLAYLATSALSSDVDPAPVGSGHPSVCPYGAWPTEDGWIVIAVLSDKFWPPMCAALGLEGLAARPDLDTNAGRLAARDEIEAAISGATARLATPEAVAALREAGVPHAPVLSVIEALTAPYVRDRGLVARVDAPGGGYDVVPGPLWNKERVTAAPGLGEHTIEVLTELLGPESPIVEAHRTHRVP
jgi:crotonobetainyl-CoA:carnitine CoA-transferase CaiB-like acyl-CoA transferase